MKYLFCSLLPIFLFASCSSGDKLKPSKAKLVGTWLSVPEPSQDDRGLKEKTTFYLSDSLVTNFYLNGQLQRTLSLTYNIEPEKEVLVLNRDGQKLEAQILELSDKTLTLQFLHNGVKRTMKRAE